LSEEKKDRPAPPGPAELAAMGAKKLLLGGRERWLIFDFDAMYRLEELTGHNALGAGLFNPLNATNLRLLLWAGCVREDPALTLDDMANWVARSRKEELVEIIDTVHEAWNGQRPKRDPPKNPPVGESSEQPTSGSSPAELESPEKISVG
jgi:hypothetical protein